MKHEYLQSIGINTSIISRDEAVFTEETSWLVGDAGVDVGLSTRSLVNKSLDFLGKGGYFLELVKFNILSINKMEERRLDMKYFTYTLIKFLRNNLKEVSLVSTSLSDKFECGTFSPLIYEVFELQSGLINRFK